MENKWKTILRMFIEDYDGFDWVKGKIIIVYNNIPVICTGCNKYRLDKHFEDILLNYTHDKDVMVVTLKN